MSRVSKRDYQALRDLAYANGLFNQLNNLIGERYDTRDRYAAQIINGLMTRMRIPETHEERVDFANRIFDMADAMMEARLTKPYKEEENG